MDRTYLISSIAQLTKRRRYLELGLYDCVNFIEIAKVVEKAVGVDKKLYQRKSTSNCIIHEISTSEFFAQNTEKFDLIFIDADHKYESVKQDLLDSLNCLTKDGIIILHDTDPMSIEYIADGYCSNSYLIHEFLETRDDLMYITLPIEEAGLTILTYKSNRRVLGFIK